MRAEVRTAILGALALLFAATAAVFAFSPAPPTSRAGVEQVVRNYLLENPEILIEMQQRLETNEEAARQQAREAALAKVGPARLVDPMVAFTEGPADAKVTVVEFFDYQCGYCKASLPAMKAALAKHPNVRFSFVEYPILSEQSLVAARAAVAARRQPGKYIPFHLALMETTGDLPEERIFSIAEMTGIDVIKLRLDMEDPSVLESLQASRALAEELGVDGTPSFLINDKFHVGQLTEDELTMLIAAAAG
jgi:protein-disulfide isomerase